MCFMNYPDKYFIVVAAEEALLMFQQDREILLINQFTKSESVACSVDEIINHTEKGLMVGYHRTPKATLEVYNNTTNVVLWSRGFQSENLANFMLDALEAKFKLSEFENLFSVRLMVRKTLKKSYRCTRELYADKLFYSL